MQQEHKWFFYRDASQLWRWECHDHEAATLKKSITGFSSLTDCVEDAVDHGYVGGGVRFGAETI
jgi:hypothetical protein